MTKRENKSPIKNLPIRRAGQFLAVIFCAGLLTEAKGTVLDDLLTDRTAWQKTADVFIAEQSQWQFRPVDGEKTIRSIHPDLTFLGKKVCESRVYFENDQIVRSEISVYNRGDAGQLDKEAFLASVKRTGVALGEALSSPGITGRTSNDRVNYYVCRRSWVTTSVAVQLDWAYVDPHRANGELIPFRAEFVRVSLMPAADVARATGVARKPEWAQRTSARTIRANVKKSPQGDCWIDGVPMVDQGEKGYCAASSSERILRYYGREVDQNEIAQLADTTALGGTSSDGMIKAIAKVGMRYQLDKKDLMTMDSDNGSFEKSSFAKMLVLYNRAAKIKKADPIDWKKYTAMTGPNVRTINIQDIYKALDPEVLRMAKSGQTQAMDQFRKNIEQYTAQGVPLLWSCMVGMFPETPSLKQQGAFGHIRLIIGYNARTKEVLYSDSWGAGHELKRLPLVDAWSMTKGLMVLKPRDIR